MPVRWLLETPFGLMVIVIATRWRNRQLLSDTQPLRWELAGIFFMSHGPGIRLAIRQIRIAASHAAVVRRLGR